MQIKLDSINSGCAETQPLYFIQLGIFYVRSYGSALLLPKPLYWSASATGVPLLSPTLNV